MPDPTSLSVPEAARAIAARRLSAEDYATAWLDLIDAQEATVGAWQYLDREQALAAARQRDREGSGGPLHGIAIAVKDLIDTVDMPTGYGSPISQGHPPAAGAPSAAPGGAAGGVGL